MNSFNFRSNNKNNQNRGEDNPFFYRNEQGFERGYSNDGHGQFFSDNFYHNQDPYFSGRNFSPRDLPTVGNMQQFAHLRNYQNNTSDSGQQTFWGDEFSGSANHIPKEETPSLLKLIIASTGLVVIVAVSWFVYKWVKEPTDTTPMLIKADQGPYKVRPDDPGGVNIPHQDKLIYGRLNKGNYYQEEGEVERLLPPQEEPEEEFLQNDGRVRQNDYQQYHQEDSQNLDGDEYYPENYDQNNSVTELYNQNIPSNVTAKHPTPYQNQQNYNKTQQPSSNNNDTNSEFVGNSGYVMTPPQYENQNNQVVTHQAYEANNFDQDRNKNYNENLSGVNRSYGKQQLNKTTDNVSKNTQTPKQIIESSESPYNKKTIDDVIEEKEATQQKKTDKEKSNGDLAAKSEYYIQLGTLTTENDAVDEWNRLSKKHSLSNYRAVIKVTESPNGKKNYRLLMGPFSDKNKTSKHASKIGNGVKVIQIESK